MRSSSPYYKIIKSYKSITRSYKSIIKSYNAIVKKKDLGTVVSGKNGLVISVATETSDWKRPESIAKRFRTPLEEGIRASPEILPPWAQGMRFREGNHESLKKPRIRVQTIHLPQPKSKKS